jgi:hypothetical protein
MPANLKQRVIPLLLLVLLAVGAYFVYGWRVRDDRSKPVPPKTIALPVSPVARTNKLTNATTVPPKADGAEKPSARFRQFRRCYQDYLRFLYLNDAVNQCYASPNAKSNFISCKDGMTDAQLKLNSTRNSLANCGDYADVARKYYDATKVAAKNGDQDAQMCYVQSAFQSGYVYAEEKPLYTDEDVSDYKADAPAYISAAFMRGDWRVVQILSTNFFEPSSGLISLIDQIGEPETVYKMDKLLQLGAAADYAKTLGYSLDGLAHPDLRPDAALPESKIAEADVWAQQMYLDHFAASPKLTKAPVPCADEP